MGAVAGSAIALLLTTACGPDESASADEAVVSATAAAASPTETTTTSGASGNASGSATRSAATSTAKGTRRSSTKAATQKKASEDQKGDENRRLYRVIRVVDGDTVRVDVNGNESVRVIGINAPESVHPDKPVECGGAAASAAAKQLLDGKRVALVFDSTQDRRDKYGRLLAYVEIPGTGDFGKIMIKQGHARERTYAAPYRRQAAYRAAEQQARTANRGVWGTCTQSQPTSATSSPAPAPTPSTTHAPAPKPTPTQTPKPKPAPPATTSSVPGGGTAPGPGWTNDALTPGYTGCRQGYPGGRINGVYWWKPIAC